jgi:hypothetical protein
MLQISCEKGGVVTSGDNASLNRNTFTASPPHLKCWRLLSARADPVKWRAATTVYINAISSYSCHSNAENL